MSRIFVGMTVCAAGMLAACSSGGSDPASSPTPPADTAPNVKLAPAVANPINPGAMVGQPCGILTKDQLSSFGAKPGTTEEFGPGKACSWKFGDRDFGMRAWFDPGATKSGLGDIYANKQQHTFDKGYFEPTTVGGQPAAFANIGDSRPQGSCVLDVGVNPNLVLTISIDAYGTGKKSCTAASNIAAKMIDTLKSGG